MIRQMSFNGFAAEDVGLFVERGEPQLPKPRIVTETVPYRDGHYDFSRADGVLHYERRTLEYDFIAHSKTPEETAEILADALSWLYSAGDGILTDEHFDGWHFEDVTCTDVSCEYADPQHTAARLKATFSAAPYMYADNGFDPTVPPPSGAVSAESYSAAAYPDDDTAAVTYSVPNIGRAVFARFPQLAGARVSDLSADGEVTAFGSSGGYFWFVSENCSSAVVTYRSEGADLGALISAFPSQFRITAYPAKYARARRL